MDEVNRRFNEIRSKITRAYPGAVDSRNRNTRVAKIIKLQEVVSATSGYYKGVPRKTQYLNKIEREIDELLTNQRNRQIVSQNTYMLRRGEQTQDRSHSRILFTNIQPEVFYERDVLSLIDQLNEYLKYRVKETQKILKRFVISIRIKVVGRRTSLTRPDIPFQAEYDLHLKDESAIMIIDNTTVDEFDFNLSYLDLRNKLNDDSNIQVDTATILNIAVDEISDRHKNKYLRGLIGFEPPKKKQIQRKNDKRIYTMKSKAERKLVHEGKLCVLESFYTKFLPQKLVSSINKTQYRLENIKTLLTELPEDLQKHITNGSVIDALLGLMKFYKFENDIVRLAIFEAKQIISIMYIGLSIDNDGENYYTTSVAKKDEILTVIKDAFTFKRIKSMFHYEEHIEPIRCEDFDRDLNRQIYHMDKNEHDPTILATHIVKPIIDSPFMKDVVDDNDLVGEIFKRIDSGGLKMLSFIANPDICTQEMIDKMTEEEKDCFEMARTREKYEKEKSKYRKKVRAEGAFINESKLKERFFKEHNPTRYNEKGHRIYWKYDENGKRIK
jgi:hypothetical protein